MATTSRQFILNRAQKTCAVAQAISSVWQWDRLTLTEMVKLRTDAEAQLDLVTRAESATAAARGLADDKIAVLYDIAVKGIGLGRRKFENVPGKKDIFPPLTAEGQSREARRRTIRRFFKAWEEADTAWELNLLGGSMGFTTFQNLRKEIEGNDTVVPTVAGLVDLYNAAEQDERLKAEKLNEMLAELDAAMIAWYADATTVCSAGTPEGDQIRGQIPTTYDPSAEPLPIPPTPSQVLVQYSSETQLLDGVCLPATFVAEYVWTLTLPGNNPEVMQLTTTEPTVQFPGVPPGLAASLTVAAQNATGISAPSAPVEVNT